MTKELNKAKFEEALEVMFEASALNDRWVQLLGDAGVDPIYNDSKRAIELMYIPSVYIYHGVKKIAEAYGTPIERGMPWEKEPKSIRTTINGITFYELEGIA